MIRDFLRVWLGVEDNTRKHEQVTERLDAISEDVETLREDTASTEEVSGLRSRVRELEGVGGQFTNREWELIQALLDKENYVDVNTLSDDLDVSSTNARAILNNVKNKIDLDSRSEGRKKLYSIPEDTRKNIFSN